MRRAGFLIASAVLAMSSVIAPSPVAHADTLKGDVNGDCFVNFYDAYLVAKSMGYSFGSLRYSESLDLNHDGHISFFDLQLVAGHFGERC